MLVSSETSGGISFSSFAIIIGPLVGITSLVFSISNGIAKKALKQWEKNEIQ